ncbi:ATP-dependent DNA ligase [Neobacillus dielmonensis]|uniref:ATP-dependent DNA ligase n=1 Tax=Neobacillus dielmonensis TaxID=1347369 RepID=UPI0005AB504E|nr:RNA ligase family protein [Neobacillus dielmonensis]
MFISPMLLQKTDHPFDDDSYITELKLDGFRTIWTKFNNQVKIYTRHNNDITSKFPELINIPVPDGTVLDGEIIVSDDKGRPDFESVMERFMSKKSEHSISFCVFDIIYFNSQRISNLPLIERKAILEEVITEDTPILNKVKWIEGNAEQYFELIKQNELEGIVQKRSESKYQINKRSNDWLKVINYTYENVCISGLRKNDFGLLLNFESGEYAGLMEFMPTANRREFYKQSKDFIVEENDKFIYFDPKIKMKVKYRNLTKKGLLRIPSFVEWVC